MSKQIKKILPDALVIGNEKNPRTGAFEVTIDEALVFSKFSKNRFPNESDIKRWFNQ